MTDKIEFRGRQVPPDYPKRLAEAQKEIFYVMYGKEWPRIHYGEEKSWLKYNPNFADNPCHDCVAIKGEYHAPGCDGERCPKCGEQFISCGCGKNTQELTSNHMIDAYIEDSNIFLRYLDDDCQEHIIPIDLETFEALLTYAKTNLPEWFEKKS